MKLTFNDPPLASTSHFQAHVAAFEACLQVELDRLHALYPRRFAQARVDATRLYCTADQLFRLGRVYIGSYGHGIDCPAAHDETIRDAVGLFEDICLNEQRSVARYGGVSSGKSGVLSLFRLLLGPLCALSDCRYVPQLIHRRLHSTIETSHDTMSAFMELYGGVEIIRQDGAASPLAEFTHNLKAAFGAAAVEPIVSHAEMLRLKADYTRHGYRVIALCDDAHQLPQFNFDDPPDEQQRPDLTVEDIVDSFDRHALITMRPELLPVSCAVRPLNRNSTYASTHSWHRGHKMADTKVSVLTIPDFINQCAAYSRDLCGVSISALKWAERRGSPSLYYRVADHAEAHRLQEYLHRAAHLESILCDGKIERSAVSDWCWRAYRHSQPFAIISCGTNPRFHRSLPPSVGLFIDWTQSSTPSPFARGLCGSASGYGRGANVMVASPENVAAIQQTNLRHRAHHRPGLPVGHLTSNMQYLADSIDYDMTYKVEVLDLQRTIQQQGKLSIDLYGLETEKR